MAPTREFFHASLNKLTIAAGFVQAIESRLQSGSADPAELLEKLAKVKRALSQLEELMMVEKKNMAISQE